MNNLLAIVGPTAVGKTRLAEEIKRYGQTGRSVPTEKIELISVDSRQVYTGMDIGTGKDAKIFGTDLTKPDKLFNVADYCRVVKPHIEKLWREGKLPILVGGTGLYLKALIDGIETIDIPPNEELRKKYANASVAKLQKILVSMYPYMSKKNERAGMNNSDWNNPRRLIRRIEIQEYLLNVGAYNYKPTALPKAGLGVYNCKPLQINKLLIIGLTAPLTVIKNNIVLRVKDRLDKGLLEEIKGLVKAYGWNEVLKNTIAYKEWEDFFAGKITKDEAIKRWTLNEMQYVKRQLTWFRKDCRVVWFENDYLNGVLKLISSSHLLD